MTAFTMRCRRLGDVTAKIGSGATPRGGKHAYHESGIALIRSMNVHDLQFVREDLAHIDDSQAAALDGVTVEAGDVLLNITGASVARCALVPADVLPARVNQHVAIIRTKATEADPAFVAYSLVAPSNKQRLLSIAQGGATREALTKGTLERFELAFPSLPVQQQVASLLSAYDGLIENNIRRVAILEEMTRALYREWFVEFRFPGRESVPAIEPKPGRLPSGWRITKLAELADVNAKSIRRGAEPGMVAYVDIAAVSTGTIGEVQRMPFKDAPGRARRLVRDGDTIWSCVRPNRRSFSLVLDPDPDLVVSTGFAVLSPKSAPSAYIYFAVTTDEFTSYLTNHAQGAAYPAVTATTFEKAPILKPEDSILARFQEAVEPMLRLIEALRRKNLNLRVTRDLLLPKLIAGEIDVPVSTGTPCRP